jgi:hypothetical protein
MHTVEFQAIIEDGIVRIPKEYKDLQKKREVRFFIMYDDNDRTNTEKRKKKMNAISIDTIDFKFDRDEAHER